MIWAHELEAFAVSLVALAATLVLATKADSLLERRRVRVGAGSMRSGIGFSWARTVASSSNTMCLPRSSGDRSPDRPHTSGPTVVFPNSLLFGNLSSRKVHRKNMVLRL